MPRKTVVAQAADDSIGSMKRKELEALIDHKIDERLRTLSRPRGDQPVSEVLASMRKNIWTPPPGAKSSLELLREDRYG